MRLARRHSCRLGLGRGLVGVNLAAVLIFTVAGCATPVSSQLTDLVIPADQVVQRARISAPLDPAVGTWAVTSDGFTWEITVVPGQTVGTREFQYVGVLTGTMPYFRTGEVFLVLNATTTPGVYSGFQKWRSAVTMKWHPALVAVRGAELVQSNDVPRAELLAISTEWRYLRTDRTDVVGTSFYYLGREYATAGEGYAAAEREIQSLVSQIRPVPKRVAGTVRVVVPPESAFRQIIPNADATTPAGLDYIARVNRRSYDGIADVLIRSQAFDSVSRESAVVHRGQGTGPADYLVWLELPSGQWYLKTRTDPTPRPLPIDVADVDPGRRWNRWVDDLITMCGAPPPAGLAVGPTPAPSTPSPPSAAAPPPSDEKPDLPALAFGTAFVIDAGGYLLTNHHVVEGARSVRVGNLGAGTLPAVVVATDPLNDLALLRVEKTFEGVLPLASINEATPGDPVVAIGYPRPGLLSSDGVLTSGTVSARTGMLDDSRELQFSAPILGGNSGGPLLDRHGVVIGVVTASLRETETANFAIKATLAREFAASHGVRAATPPGDGATLEPAAIWNRARPLTLQVVVELEDG